MPRSFTILLPERVVTEAKDRAGMDLENSHIPLHDHVACDSCAKATALVWYMLKPSNDTLAFCGPDATSHDVRLALQGYTIIRDYREKNPEELRRRLLEPAPSVDEIVSLELLRSSLIS